MHTCRSAAAEEEEDPADFEGDAVKSIVKALLMGTRHASTVREASRILAAVVAAAETVVLQVRCVSAPPPKPALPPSCLARACCCHYRAETFVDFQLHFRVHL
jgi:hypothetical protein